MKAKPHLEESSQLFQQDLEHLLDQRRPLYKLANQLPWDELEKILKMLVELHAKGIRWTQERCRNQCDDLRKD